MSGRRVQILKTTGVLAMLFVLAQAYTNCSSPYQLLVQGSIMAANDLETLKRLTTGGTWQIQISSLDQEASATSLSTLTSNAPASVNLALGDAGTGPTVVSSAAYKKNTFQFQSTQTVQTSPLESAMVSDVYSVVALVDAGSTGNVIAINNGERGAQELAILFPAPGTIQIVHSTSATDRVTLTQTLDVRSGPIMIGVSFGATATDIALQINGNPSANALVNMGTPGDSAFMLRQLTLGDSTAGTSFQLGELDVFTEKLTPATMNSVLRAVATKWGLLGMNYIPQPKEEITVPTVSPEFLPVQQILQSQCAACHGPGSTYYFVGLSEDGLASSRWVVKGSGETSALYTNLSGVSSGTMPLNASALTPAQIQSIKTWIDGLN